MRTQSRRLLALFGALLLLVTIVASESFADVLPAGVNDAVVEEETVRLPNRPPDLLVTLAATAPPNPPPLAPDVRAGLTPGLNLSPEVLARLEAARRAARATRSAPRPAAQPAPRTAAPAGDVWARLRACESGGNYAANTGNGYYGAYQFSLSTWRGLGYGGYPHQAAPATQDEAARRLQARSGWGQWPACSRKLGLR